MLLCILFFNVHTCLLLSVFTTVKLVKRARLTVTLLFRGLKYVRPVMIATYTVQHTQCRSLQSGSDQLTGL